MGKDVFTKLKKIELSNWIKNNPISKKQQSTNNTNTNVIIQTIYILFMRCS
jgi:hypothetical protein